MEEIKQYLAQDEKDYQTGIILLSKHHKNRNLINALSRKDNSTNREKLYYELRKIAGDSNAPVLKVLKEVKIVKPSNEQSTPATSGSDTGKIPAKVGPTPEAEQQYQELLTKQSALYTQRCQLSNTLADQQTDDERKAVADKIDALQKEYNELAVTRKYFEENGKFPEVTIKAEAADQEPIVDKAELLKTRNNLRSQVSKAKTALNKKPEDTAKQEKLVKLQLELDSVELQLKHIADQEKAAAQKEEELQNG